MTKYVGMEVGHPATDSDAAETTSVGAAPPHHFEAASPAFEDHRSFLDCL